MAIIDVVKWDGYASQLAWKFDQSQELSTWTQLIVNESQEAVLFRGGAMDGPFGPGRHVLKTENIPIISELLKLPFGRSPFTAEVWYVNRVIALDVLWDTEDPIQLLDPVHKVIVPVLASGQYGVQISNSRKFLVKLVGTMPEFTQERLSSYLRGMILSIAKATVAKEIVQKKISILEIATELVALSDAIRNELAVQLDEFGLKLVSFYVSSISASDDDPSIRRLRDALAKRAEMDIIGFSYQQERSLDVLQTAAGNEGSAGTLMGSGIGLGAGLGLGNAMGQGFAGVATSMQAQPVAPAVAGQAAPLPACCPACSAPRSNPLAKFCSSCGTAFAVSQACANCGEVIAAGAKFCGNCGTRVAAPACIACGQPLAAGARFCGECGAGQSTPV